MAINGRTESGTVRTVAGRASLNRGIYGAKIIKTIIRDGREWQLHATKGWRSYRHSGGQS